MWKRVFSSNALLENFKGQLYIPFNGFLGGIELIVVNEDVWDRDQFIDSSTIRSWLWFGLFDDSKYDGGDPENDDSILLT